MDHTISNTILPDACIDIVIDFSKQIIQFAGYSKETVILNFQGNIDYLGVRLKPGAFYTLFHIAADKIMDCPSLFHKIEQELDLFGILEEKTTDIRMTKLKQYFLKKVNNNQNTIYIEMIHFLYQNPSEQSVKEIALRFGYDRRHLVRLFKKYYGVTPKVLLNILRLHLCLTLLLETEKNISDIIFDCGFYDQSHFIKEMKRYIHISPLQLLEKYHL